MSATPEDLVTEGVKVLRAYLKDRRTEQLRHLAELVVELRGTHTLEDGRKDWSGRSHAYRQNMAALYSRAQVPADTLDTLQAALRYHVGNLLRDRAKEDELEAVGLSTVAPKTRLATNRQAMQAMRREAPKPQDVAKIAAYCQALIEHIDADAVPDLPGDQAVAARLALEAVQRSAAQLLVRLEDARPKRKTRRSASAAV